MNGRTQKKWINFWKHYCSVTRSCPTCCDLMDCTQQAPWSSTISWICSNSCPLSLWCHSNISSSVTLFSCPQSFPESGSFPVSQLFTSGRKYWSFNFSIRPSNEYSGLISFRTDWFDLAVQGTLKSLQYHSLKPAVLQRSAFFMVQLSHLYTTTGKTIALTICTFVGKMMSLFCNMLSMFVIAFLPRSKLLLISWLQSLSTVIFGSQEEKICHCFHFFPIYLPWSDGLDAMILAFWMLSFKLSSFIFIKGLFSSSPLSSVRVVSPVYLRLLIFLPEILIPAYDSSSLAFHIMYYAYKLNKQGDNIQPWHTPFPIWNQSIVPCKVLTVASWPGYRFLRRQVRWFGTPISLRIFHSWSLIHIVKGFSIVSEADVFLELPCFLHDPTNVGNLISGSSAFLKPSLYLKDFSVHVLLKFAWRILSITLLACEMSATLW